jgi:hypothetical protein
MTLDDVRPSSDEFAPPRGERPADALSPSRASASTRPISLFYRSLPGSHPPLLSSSLFGRQQMITTNKKKLQPRAKRTPKAAAGAAPAAGGARARYSGAGAPAANGRQAQAAANIQAGQGKLAGEAFKIIVSNLPLDVDDAAVKVRTRFLLLRVVWRGGGAPAGRGTATCLPHPPPGPNRV